MKVQTNEALFVIEKVRYLTESTYVLRFSRNEIQFTPGQHLVLGLPESAELREYSIYSGINDNFLEVLIKQVDDGLVSQQLKAIRPGDQLEVRGPYGFFLNSTVNPNQTNLLFISSGTGIAPFHSFVKSFPDTDYQVIHGVRNMKEAYDAADYHKAGIVVCTSRDNSGNYHGRLTDYLLKTELDPNSQVYLCGNSNMIFDAMDILLSKGISQRQMFTEVYF